MSPPSPRSRIYAASAPSKSPEAPHNSIGLPELPEWAVQLFPTLRTNHLPEMVHDLLPPRETTTGPYASITGISDPDIQAGTLDEPPLQSQSAFVELVSRVGCFWPFCDYCGQMCSLRAEGIEPHVAPIDYLVKEWGKLELAKARSKRMEEILARSKSTHKLEAEACSSDIADLDAIGYLLERGQANLKLYRASLLRSSSNIEVQPENTVSNSDGSYHDRLREAKKSGRVFTPRIFAPRHFTGALSSDDQTLEHKEYGICFDESESTIVLDNRSALLYVCHQDNLESKRKVLGASSTSGFLEVSLEHWVSNTTLYYGNFEFRDEWFPFTEATTRDLPELFAKEGYSKPDCIQFAELKLQWSNPDTDFRFCILRYREFNEHYFRLHAVQKPKRAACHDDEEEAKEEGVDDSCSHRRNRRKVEDS